MNGYQIIAVSILGLLLLISLTAMFRGWATRREGAAWSAIFLAAIVATIRPQITQDIANALDIDRGADLVFYCGVLVMMVGFWMTYLRMRRLRRDVTLLVRHIAILEARGSFAPLDRPSPDGH